MVSISTADSWKNLLKTSTPVETSKIKGVVEKFKKAFGGGGMQQADVVYKAYKKRFEAHIGGMVFCGTPDKLSSTAGGAQQVNWTSTHYIGNKDGPEDVRNYLATQEFMIFLATNILRKGNASNKRKYFAIADAPFNGIYYYLLWPSGMHANDIFFFVKKYVKAILRDSPQGVIYDVLQRSGCTFPDGGAPGKTPGKTHSKVVYAWSAGHWAHNKLTLQMSKDIKADIELCWTAFNSDKQKGKVDLSKLKFFT